MVRKQPIPTTFIYNHSLDFLDKMVFSLLWSMTRNVDGFVNFYHGNKYISHELKRGQVIISIKKLSDETGISYKRLKKSLEKIQKTENEMEIESKARGLVITWKNYEESIKMENETPSERNLKEIRKKSEGESINKSVKIEENVEIEKEILPNGSTTEKPVDSKFENSQSIKDKVSMLKQKITGIPGEKNIVTVVEDAKLVEISLPKDLDTTKQEIGYIPIKTTETVVLSPPVPPTPPNNYTPEPITIEINAVIQRIKDACNKYGIVYGPDPQARNFAKHLMSKKFKNECLDQVGKGLEDFIDMIIGISSMLKYGKVCNNPVTIYRNWSDVINRGRQQNIADKINEKGVVDMRTRMD